MHADYGYVRFSFNNRGIRSSDKVVFMLSSHAHGEIKTQKVAIFETFINLTYNRHAKQRHVIHTSASLHYVCMQIILTAYTVIYTDRSKPTQLSGFEHQKGVV